MKEKKKFSIVKLLIILGIIAVVLYLIILAIAAPVVNEIKNQAQDGATEASGNEIIKGAELYYNTCDINTEYKDLDGDDCLENLISKTGNVYDVSGTSDVKESTRILKNKINVKIDIPNIDDIKLFTRDSDGDVVLKYKQGKYYCYNIDTPNKAVTCQTTKPSNWD